MCVSRLCLSFLLLVASCAAVPAVAPAFAHVDADVSETVPLLATLVRAWSFGGPPEVRRVLAERLREDGLAVVEGEGSVVVGSGPLLLLVRLADVPACRDPEGGVAVGEPPRLIGCGTQDLFGVAAFAVAVLQAGAQAKELTLGVVDDDDALARVLDGRLIKAAWSPGGVLHSGADRDVLDVVSVDVGRLTLGLQAPDADRVLVAAGRALSFSPRPRLPVVIAERLAAIGGPFLERAVDLAADPVRRSLVVDRCSLVWFASAQAVVRCTALPGRPLQEVIDGVVLAIDDPAVRVQVLSKQEPTSTSLSAPLPSVLSAVVSQGSPRVIVAPALDTSFGPSACHHLRRRGVPCIASLPLRLHPALRERRGQPDEVVPADAVAAAAAFVVDVVAAFSVFEVLR